MQRLSAKIFHLSFILCVISSVSSFCTYCCTRYSGGSLDCITSKNVPACLLIICAVPYDTAYRDLGRTAASVRFQHWQPQSLLSEREFFLFWTINRTPHHLQSDAKLFSHQSARCIHSFDFLFLLWQFISYCRTWWIKMNLHSFGCALITVHTWMRHQLGCNLGCIISWVTLVLEHETHFSGELRTSSLLLINAVISTLSSGILNSFGRLCCSPLDSSLETLWIQGDVPSLIIWHICNVNFTVLYTYNPRRGGA